MTDAPDLVAMWRAAYEAEKARREAVEAELARVREQGAGDGATSQALPEEIEATIARFSFGNPGLTAAHRTYARTQLAARATAQQVVAALEAGGYRPDVEDEDL